jgi:hypothetical protein
MDVSADVGAVPMQAVGGTYVVLAAPQALIAPLRRTAQHAQHLDPAALKPSYLSPELIVALVVGAVVVQGDVARPVVQVDGGDYDVSRAGVVGEEGQERVVIARRVVEGLVVYNQAWALRRR